MSHSGLAELLIFSVDKMKYISESSSNVSVEMQNSSLIVFYKSLIDVVSLDGVINPAFTVLSPIVVKKEDLTDKSFNFSTV